MMNSRFDSYSRWMRPWSGGGVMLALFAAAGCSGTAVDGGGGVPGVGGQGIGGSGGTWGSGGQAVGGGVGGQPVPGGAPGEDLHTGGTGSGAGGSPMATGGTAAGTGGAAVHDREACDHRQTECFVAVEALCAVLESYDCEHLVQECISVHDACQRNWIATCPRGVSECYSRAELCYSSGLSNDVCDEIFFGCGEEARLCLDAISSEEPELPEEEIEFLRESGEVD